MFSQDARRAIEEELGRGEAARLAGNEGRARVCARRAAGIALRETLGAADTERISSRTASAYDLLRAVQDLETIPARAKAAASNLLARVDEHHNLPAEMDLLQEVRNLIEELERLV